MTQEERDTFVEELKSKGYRNFPDSYRYNYASYYKTYNKDMDNEYSICFREWNHTGFAEFDDHFKEDPFDYDIEIRFSKYICILTVGFPNECHTLEEAEKAAEILLPSMMSVFHLKYDYEK